MDSFKDSGDLVPITASVNSLGHCPRLLEVLWPYKGLFNLHSDYQG